MNIFRRLFSKVCSHMKNEVLDRYPEEEWTDAGADSNIYFTRGTLKMRCKRCGVVHLMKREFITRNKEDGKISNL